jgi:hypothetical protein
MERVIQTNYHLRYHEHEQHHVIIVKGHTQRNKLILTIM